MPVILEDFSIQVKEAIEAKSKEFLYTASEMVKTQAAQTSPVATGQLSRSWDYIVDDKESRIGSPIQNAIWNELGTGEYAANGDGRKGGWSYKDDSGKWHYTRGKKPRHTLQRAFDANKAKIIARARSIFKELG